MKQAGFTLIEVLVALLIFSLAIVGLTAAGTESARAVSIVDTKMLAGIVADNQLVLLGATPLRAEKKSGQAQQMSRDFTYDIETIKTDTPGFYRVIVRVWEKDGAQILAERTAFRSTAK